MASAAKTQVTCAVLVAALLMCAPARAAMVVGADGKPIRRATGGTVVIGEAGDGACKAPSRYRVVAFNLAPETKLADAITWISPIICKQFLVRDTILAKARRLPTVAPERMMTPNEAYLFFLVTLGSVGLCVEPSGKFLRIVSGAGCPRIVPPEPYITVLVRVQDLPPEAQERLLEWRGVDICHGDPFAPLPDTLIITDLQSTIERLLGHVLPLPAERGEGRGEGSAPPR